jgi:hypothetical protein
MNCFPVLTACLMLATSGCAVVSVASTGGDPIDPSPPVQLSIDPGAKLESTPGTGVGLFVQYEAGGRWTLFTTCDTLVTKVACSFDVFITPAPGAVLSLPTGASLTKDDTVTLLDNGGIHLSTITSTGSSGMSFDADPGAVMEVDLLFDGVEDPRYIFSIGDGALREGAPSDPVFFAPSSP